MHIPASHQPQVLESTANHSKYTSAGVDMHVGPEETKSDRL